MMRNLVCIFCFVLLVLTGCGPDHQVRIEGELLTWHRITLSFRGPQLSETGSDNPFLDYRLQVTFTQDNDRTIVPGFFAADGNAGETGAESGNVWQVRFMPDREGIWEYSVSFRKGENIALDADEKAGAPLGPDGLTGTLEISKSEKSGRDFRGKGLLSYVGERYLQFTGTGEYFLKGGADSPENFLAFVDFDGTPKTSHSYLPHAADWQPGDPQWRGDKGHNIIGALNYLASKGMNSVYFLTMNVEGDGKDVWPWTGPEERTRFDCSKLDQWEIVFSHMDKLGLLMHVITQETENDTLLDHGDLGPERMLYYRELIARFAHHPALVWNLGEENTNTEAQRKAFSGYIHATDPYQHPIVVHTFPDQYEKLYGPLLGTETLEGVSLQMGDKSRTHNETVKWINRSAEKGRPWFVCLDEIGPADIGVVPDADDPTHDDVRRYALWGNLMAGGSGCEWYFGYKYPNNDLNCEDWRSRENMWDQTRIALEFFQNNLPFWEMSCHDELLSNDKAWCLADPGQVYLVYLPGTTDTRLSLEDGTFRVQWFNPVTGGALMDGSLITINGPGLTSIGAPPVTEKDWVALVKLQ